MESAPKDTTPLVGIRAQSNDPPVVTGDTEHHLNTETLAGVYDKNQKTKKELAKAPSIEYLLNPVKKTFYRYLLELYGTVK